MKKEFNHLHLLADNYPAQLFEVGDGFLYLGWLATLIREAISDS
jgi:hypothetical protein